MSYDLVGNDVTVYAMQPYGYQGNMGPGQNPLYNMLGVWKDLSLDFDLTYSETTPSQQLLKQGRLTGLNWTMNVSHLLATGGGYAMYALTSFNLMVKLVWQEEYHGGTFTAIGAITKVNYKRDREVGMESLTIENQGPIGNTGTSLWYSFAGAINPDLTNAVVQAQVNVVQARFSGNYSAPNTSSLVAGGFNIPTLLGG